MANLGFKYRVKRQFKRRYSYTRNVRLLRYGYVGFRALSTIFMNQTTYMRLFIWVSWHLAKRARYRWHTWFHLVGNIARTRKSAKSRMGKGKGKLRGFLALLTPGHFLFEFRIFHYNRIVHFFNFLQGKLRNRLQFVSHDKYFYIPGINRQTIPMRRDTALIIRMYRRYIFRKMYRFGRDLVVRPATFRYRIYDNSRKKYHIFKFVKGSGSLCLRTLW